MATSLSFKRKLCQVKSGRALLMNKAIENTKKHQSYVHEVKSKRAHKASQRLQLYYRLFTYTNNYFQAWLLDSNKDQVDFISPDHDHSGTTRCSNCRYATRSVSWHYSDDDMSVDIY